MATTTNFGWTTPNDTDLVKDGAAAIRTLGSSIDTSMAQLKGGTTGQVLSKTSNTDMAFTWVAQDDSNAIQNALVDAKGDLIAATANDTPARLAVGNNGETLVADSSTSTGLRYTSNFAAGKNAIINGDFGIWQRGTSFTNPGNSFNYTADRFQSGANAATTTQTVTRQTFTPGTAPVAGYEGQYFFRSTLTNIGSATVVALYNKIENVQTFAGQTVTLSFWAKGDSARTLNVESNQNFGSGGSGSVGGLSSNFTLSTSWQRFTATFSVASIAGKTIGTGSYLGITFNQAVSNGSVLDLWGVQLEAGSVATAFQTATGTIQGELAACQRYYYRTSSNGATTFTTVGNAYSTTNAVIQTRLPVTMRVTPTAVDFSTLQMYSLTSGGQTAITSVSLNAGNGDIMEVIGAVGSGLTSGHIVNLRGNGSGAFLGFSAEL
jgi:hypothetical protein